ncbi:hypothetical protein L0U85_01715 [Glycomyces sp. L485]|uniref:hypothetical protein n=1 Tax=Glycomyces sp. L485 TaxID=2909235 RepID=UPI001F4B082F|nr:hypothetical protein [Glycomyces sp. L485]MCH7229585.1 hypothetical protein [Glycomyces sp. L485]
MLPERDKDSEYSVRYGFLLHDLWRYPLLSLFAATGVTLLLVDMSSEYRRLPRSLQQAIGLVALVMFSVILMVRLAMGLFRPLALRADRSGLTIQPFGLLSGYMTIPWREVASITVRTDATKASNQWLVVKRAAKSRPLRRRLPFTALHGMAASQIHACDPRYDVAVPVDFWWRLDREHLAAAVETFAPRRIPLNLD